MIKLRKRYIPRPTLSLEGAGATGCSVLKWSVLALDLLSPALVLVALVLVALGFVALGFEFVEFIRLFLPLIRCLCSILSRRWDVCCFVQFKFYMTANYSSGHHKLSINNRIMSAKFRLPAIERI